MKKYKIKKKLSKRINLSDIIDAEIKSTSLRQGFSNKIISQLKSIRKFDENSHKDFTSIPFVTIDGENSKDFDDAVYCEVNDNNTRIMVAIADVSFFVEKNDPIDLEARKRGNSFYFPDRVIPMLPEKLSNDICSLIPRKIRACVICEIQIKGDKIEKYQFHRGKIKSVARLTYKEVDEIQSDKKSKYFDLVENLFHALDILVKFSEKRGKLKFNNQEYEVNFKNSEEFEFKKKPNYKSYRLIEELMVLANNVTANLLFSKGVKSAFRNHDRPKKEKVVELKKALIDRQIKNNRDFNTQSDFNFYLQNISSKDFNFLNDLMLRTQSKAYYDINNIGHFGLGLEYYTHFTSPIRRYSDLIVHRDLLEIIFSKNSNKNSKELMEYLTNQEKRGDDLERKVIERACSLYIKRKKIYYFNGIVDGIEDFGIFIKAIDLPFSGLARFRHISRAISKNSIQLGQQVNFKIIKNNINNGKILIGNVKIIGSNE